MIKNKIFLTSAITLCTLCPAIAESFPSDGNMVENETYANAAVYDNTGVYEGTATANAYYTTNNYNVSAGSYLSGLNNDNTATTATCTSGNYCPGVQSTTYDDVNSAFVDDGLQTCPSGYASSDLGASADTQCYRTCDIANMGANGTIAAIAHAATLSGNDYYGNGTDTCEPATCVAGWHRKAGSNGAQVQSDLIGLGNVTSSYVYISNDGTGSSNASDYGLSSSDHNSFAIEYEGVGVLRGHGRCSTQEGDNNSWTWTNPTKFASLTDETGQEGAKYCYCQVDDYTPANGTLQSVSSPWVLFGNQYGQSSMCASTCASTCGQYARGDQRFREALVGSIESTPASCEANTINITWNDASAEDIAATGAATTIYEGDIKTPLKAITKPGKTFVGWKFVKPTTPVQQ